MCARLLLFCFQCFLGNASLSCRRHLQRRRQTQLQRCRRLKRKERRQLALDLPWHVLIVLYRRHGSRWHSSPSGGHTAPICSSCAAVHVCVESGRPTLPSISAFRCPRTHWSKSAQSCKKWPCWWMPARPCWTWNRPTWASSDVAMSSTAACLVCGASCGPQTGALCVLTCESLLWQLAACSRPHSRKMSWRWSVWAENMTSAQGSNHNALQPFYPRFQSRGVLGFAEELTMCQNHHPTSN